MLQAALGDFDILLCYDKSHISTDASALAAFERKLACSNVRVCEVNPSPPYPNKTKLRCAIYARVASIQQNDTPLDKQVAACRSYAARQGWKLAKSYSEAAAATHASQRPSFRNLIEDARRKEFDIVLATDHSRFSRDLTDSEWFCQEMRKAGVRVHLLSNAHSIQSPASN